MRLLSLKISILTVIILTFTACNFFDTKVGQIAGEDSVKVTAKQKTSFLFLTEWFNQVGVYRYDLVKKKYYPVWWHPRENVVMLIYRPGDLPAFFLTADRIGKKGSFPFFEDVKLFRIANDFSGTKRIDKIGDGYQFTARWNEDENLEVIYTSVDKSIPSYISQFTKVYDHYGKLIDSGVKTFDIEKSGFPQITPLRGPTISPSGKYGVSVRHDSVFLKYAGNGSLSFITTKNHGLNKIGWNEDEKYLIISTLNLSDKSVNTENPESSELYVYLTGADSLIEGFKGAGVKNFFTSDDLLIFDDGFGKNSRINIYDLKKQKITDMIRPGRGCGLVIIPQI